MADEGFLYFNRMFADYPTLQKELSLLDKSATNGKPSRVAPSIGWLMGR